MIFLAGSVPLLPKFDTHGILLPFHMYYGALLSFTHGLCVATHTHLYMYLGSTMFAPVNSCPVLSCSPQHCRHFPPYCKSNNTQFIASPALPTCKTALANSLALALPCVVGFGQSSLYYVITVSVIGHIINSEI